nr:NC domain-containing protein-related protein [Tanacetum cinerariifolium]
VFLAKARGGTCTLAVSDPPEAVVHRANYLLNNGFGCYNVFKNNCEDFAIYCKTGLLVVDQRTMGQSGQAVSIIGGPLAAVFRYAADIGMRRDVMRFGAEDLTRRIATGAITVAEPSLPALMANNNAT